MDSLSIYCAGVVVVFIALFGFIALVQRASRRKEQLGSRVLINASALLVGLGAVAVWLLGIMPIGFYGVIGLMLAALGGFGLVRELWRKNGPARQERTKIG